MNEEAKINWQIMEERNKELKELASDMIVLNDICVTLSSLIGEQSERLDVAEKNIEETLVNTQIGVVSLEEAKRYKHTKLLDIGIVIGGGLVGSVGFLLGPIVGISTLVAGISAAAVINKVVL